MSTYAIHAFTVNDALVAGRDLLRIAKGKKLHRTLAAALVRVKRTNEALDAASRSIPKEDDPLVLGGSEAPAQEGLFLPLVALRKAFAAVRDLLKVHAQLPEGDSVGDTARAVLAALFPEGTGFLTSDASELDVACGRVLERTAHPKVAKALQTLGCNPHMKAAKTAYGAFVMAREASVDAHVESSSNDNVAVYNDAIDALREYARLVEAHALLEGASLDRVLLAPLAHKRIARQRAPKGITPEPTEGDRIDEAPPSRAA
ncbi:MAG: hypothetical protein IPK71_11140 [Myxococcales bacterium]|nr:hypothetical protein [Myxococcales bacterium]